MFSEEYDRTLWLMLVSDKSGRDSLANFVKDIPLECYSEIRDMINKYKETKTLQSVSLVKMINAGLNKLCFDAHVYEDGELSLILRKYTTLDKVVKGSEFVLKLMPLDARLPIIVGNRYLGEIRDVRRNVVGDTIADYEDSIFEVLYQKKFQLRRTPVGCYISVDSERFIEPDYIIGESQKHSKYMKRVCVRKIPDTMFVHQFENKKRVDRLVRCKKKCLCSGKTNKGSK